MSKLAVNRKSIFRASLFGISMTGVFFPFMANAQQETESRSSQVAEDDSYGLDVIIVTARKRAENLQTTPISVTELGEEALKDRSVTLVSEIANYTPGMAISQNQASPLSVTFQLRGQSQNDLIVALDPPVGVYSDGVFMNAAIGVLGSSVVDLDRVEILKGPQGTLYGRNTTGGAVNFYTNLPTDRWEGQITAGAGSYDAYEVSGVLNAPLGENAAIRLVGERRGDNGYGTNYVTGERIGDRKSTLLRGTLSLGSGPFKVILRADYSRARSDGGMGVRPLFLRPGSNAERAIAQQLGVSQTAAYDAYYDLVEAGRTNPWREGYNAPHFAKMRAFGGSATLEYDLGGATVKSITAYRDIRDDKSVDLDGTRFELFTLHRINTRIKQFTQELQLVGDTFGDRLHYALGAFYIHSDGRDDNSSSALVTLSPATNPTNRLGRVVVESPAVYGQATFDLTSTLHVTGGLRYTYESRDTTTSNVRGPTGQTCQEVGVLPGQPCTGRYPYDNENLSYTAGVDWSVTPDVMLYAKTSRGFKSGGVNTRHTENPASAAPFRPEVVTDYEAGLKSQFFDRRVRFNLSYFHSRYSDVQRTVARASAPPFLGQVTNIENAAKATIDGVELEIAARPTPRLTLQGGLGYTKPQYISYIAPDGTDQSNQDFLQVSKWAYFLSANYNVPTSFGEIGAQIDWSWRSKRNLSPAGLEAAVVRPGYGLLNGQIRLQFESIDLDARLFMKNILDKTYDVSVFDTSTSLGVVDGVLGAPRTWGISVTKNF